MLLPRMSKSALRTSAVVGRMSRPRGESTTRPRKAPLVIRVWANALAQSVQVEHGSVAVHRLGQGGIACARGVGLEPALCGSRRALQQRVVEEVGGAHLRQPVLTQADDVAGT